MIYAQKYGVSRASRKYNKSRSFIYFWMARYDGTLESLACRSRRPHSHPNQHTPAELKLIRDMRRRNPDLGIIELWSRLKKRGYTRCPESLFRVMRRMGMFPESKPKKKYQTVFCILADIVSLQYILKKSPSLHEQCRIEHEVAAVNLRYKLIRLYIPMTLLDTYHLPFYYV
jgi:transposase